MSGGLGMAETTGKKHVEVEMDSVISDREESRTLSEHTVSEESKGKNLIVDNFQDIHFIFYATHEEAIDIIFKIEKLCSL
jgi:hypothetical protein